jgi:hypothetical protein
MEPDFLGSLNFQSEAVERGLFSKGNVYAIIDPVTSGFSSFNGTDVKPIEVPIYNARKGNFSVHENGFQLVNSVFSSINYYDELEVLNTYYAEVAEFVKCVTGAYKVDVINV